jgi:hypothetical protein
MKGESKHPVHLLLIIAATEQQFHAKREGCARFEKLKVVLVAAQNAIINVDFRSACYWIDAHAVAQFDPRHLTQGIVDDQRALIAFIVALLSPEKRFNQ